MNTQPIQPTEPVGHTEMRNAASGSSPTADAAAILRLADYELTERLGAGGYGEVWKATGPGGLPKAVKILYGQQDGTHAEAELKALERMRDLRHPFLLSIERIEVIESRLIVVTELADRNLADRFREIAADGHCGIPRDELLNYLQDAADALDFMAEKHGLQHLDIKPDNILLQGDHAKVADFGLAKDLNATNVSVLNGFTPTYAAPELFEGRPGRASDQYSLAIVYQSMLTGQVPFNGRTAAQLTAQHLKSKPDLSSLEPVDRPVVARALSKNQQARFDSCRQFIDELQRRKHQVRSATAPTLPADRVSDHAPDAAQKIADTRDLAREQSTPVPVEPASSRDRKPRPAVFLGIGGLGGRILGTLKSKLKQTGRDETALPVLAIDTDRAVLAELQQAGGLNAEQTLAIPLKSSKDYRNARSLDLSWLSRRWLFNIPRSGLVEGIRPLGRLALVDHREVIQERIGQLLRNTLLSLPEAEGLDVYVVGASSGGTASGALADLGFLTAEAARTLDGRDLQIHGVLVHGTGSTRSPTDVQEANTVCLLQELTHLSTPGLLSPRGCDNQPSDQQPFHNTYLVHLGDGLSQHDYSNETTNVAGFLMAATTEAQFDLRAWRESSVSKSPFTVRMLGLSDRDAATLSVATDHADDLCGALLKRWADAETDSSGQAESPSDVAEANSILQDLTLTSDTLPPQIRGLLVGQLRTEIQTCADRLHQLAVAQTAGNLSNLTLIDFLQSQLSQSVPVAEQTTTLAGIILKLRTSLQDVTQRCEVTLRRHVLAKLDSPQRLKAAMVSARRIRSTLHHTGTVCRSLLAEVEAAFDEFLAGVEQEVPLDQEAALRLTCEYCGLICYQTVYQCFLQHVAVVEEAVAEVQTSLDHLRTALKACGRSKADSIGESQASVVEAFDRYLRSAHPSLLAESVRTGQNHTQLQSQVRAAATQFLIAATDGTDSRQTAANDFPKNCWPRFRGSGGRRRVLGIVPPDFDQQELVATLKQEFDDCVATRTQQTDSVCVICEVEGVDAEKLVQRMTHSNPHIADVASRIRTRTDVDW